MRPAKILQTAIGLHTRVATAPGRPSVSRKELGQWLGQELQSLGGPLPLKLGQWASNRSDLFGDVLTKELAVLRDEVQPMTTQEVQKILETSCILESIEDIDLKPIASASIGQVHVGKLRHRRGEAVAIKLRRPKVVQHIKHDGAILLSFVTLLEHLKVPDAQEARKMLHEVLDAFLDETDFRREVANMQRFPKMKGVLVPQPYTDLCSDDIIVMSFLPSSPAFSVPASKRKALATKLMHTFLYQLFQLPVLHADPHPGNFGVNGDGDLVLYDFGNMIDLSQDFQFQLKVFILAMVAGNVSEARRILSEDMKLRIIDNESLDEWLDAYFKYIKTPGLDARASFADISNPRMQPITFTPDLLRIVRAFSSLEGTCTSLSPNFNYLATLETFLDTIIFDQTFMEQKALYDLKRFLK